MRHFVVIVNQTGRDDVICGSRGNTFVPAGDSVTYQCPGTATGSGVFLRKLPEAPEPNLITICEVQVDGHVAQINLGEYQPLFHHVRVNDQ